MTNPSSVQKAIEDAIKGGYNRYPMPQRMERVNGIMKTSYDGDIIFTDPEFWRALGKMKGWKKDENYRAHRVGDHSDDFGGTSDYPCRCNEPKDWKDYAVEWFETRMSNGSEEEFFERLQ